MSLYPPIQRLQRLRLRLLSQRWPNWLKGEVALNSLFHHLGWICWNNVNSIFTKMDSPILGRSYRHFILPKFTDWFFEIHNY